MEKMKKVTLAAVTHTRTHKTTRTERTRVVQSTTVEIQLSRFPSKTREDQKTHTNFKWEKNRQKYNTRSLVSACAHPNKVENGENDKTVLSII